MNIFTWIPATQTAEVTPRALVGRFGEEGPEQRVADGINPYAKRYTLTFSGPTVTPVEAFLVAQGAAKSFYWSPYKEAQAAFVCPAFSVPRKPGEEVTLIATFERVYIADSTLPAPYGVYLPSNGINGMLPEYVPINAQDPATVAWVLNLFRFGG